MVLLRNYLLALLVFNLAACSSMQTVSVENAMKSSPPRGVDYGSMVEVMTLDKRSANFRVTDINTDGLGGASGFFRYEDMASLKVENVQQQKKKQSNAGTCHWRCFGRQSRGLNWLYCSRTSWIHRRKCGRRCGRCSGYSKISPSRGKPVRVTHLIIFA